MCDEKCVCDVSGFTVEGWCCSCSGQEGLKHTSVVWLNGNGTLEHHCVLLQDLYTHTLLWITFLLP